jgi:hypothetical protein
MTSDVEIRGPFFDDVLYEAASRHFQQDATMDIADQGARDVRVRLSQVLKHPTGRYEASIRAREQPFDTAKVDGETLIYAWWLEGVGSRNFPVTRFRGYNTFELVTPELQANAVGLAGPSFERFIEEIS